MLLVFLMDMVGFDASGVVLSRAAGIGLQQLHCNDAVWLEKENEDTDFNFPAKTSAQITQLTINSGPRKNILI